MAEMVRTADLLRSAGRVDSGPGVSAVHLVVLLGGTRWATACPADYAGLDGAGETRQVRLVSELVDCPACLTEARDQVREVNQQITELLDRDALARGLLTAFLRWAAESYPDGGAVLATYAGDTRLHAMRDDERARAVELWIESTRERPTDV
ncbi:hypothetical protein AB0A95_33345 [Micromonospora sp. NPDC049230]|uniref:hypothetical protein n=1 Tax=Micromonospora sp. NPDC049230 TaxID=3155502 RepID=UPI0033D60C5C